MPESEPRMDDRAEWPPADTRWQFREIALIVLTAVVFLGFVGLQLAAPTGDSRMGDVTFFLLINLNVILVILLAFLVGRNLIRLTIDRRRGIFGSRLRTRLVVLFVGLSLLPSVVLFVVARGFLNDAIDTWFDSRVKTSLRGSAEIAEAYYQFAAHNAVHFAEGLAAKLAAEGHLQEGNSAGLRGLVDRQRSEMNLAGLEVIDASGHSVYRSQDRTLENRPLRAPASTRTRLLAGEKVAETLTNGDGDLIRTGVPIEANGVIIGAVSVDYVVPKNVSRKARDIGRAYDEYLQLVKLEQPLKNQYVITLALVTLVVVFSAIWVGIRQARNISVPLQRLAEGTREVAQGNWEHRIDAGHDRETDVLVDAFNQMTGDLELMNAALEERTKYVENILANVTVGVVSLDRSGELTTLNRAAESMLGLRFREVRGRHWSEAFRRSDLAEIGQLIAEIVQMPEQLISRQVRLTGGEQPITALVGVTSLIDDNDVQRGVMLFLENVTDLLRVQRMEAWREVARRLAHEIKNPLTPIQLSAQRIAKRFRAHGDDDDRRVLDDCTQTIVAQVDALKHLVTEFSSFARLPTVELRSDDINLVVEEAVTLYRAGHPEIEFHFAPGEGLPEVQLDPEAIKRLIINLLDNAVAACESAPERAGRVDLATQHLVAREVVQLEVADNGCGMTAETKARIFEPYYSTKKDGTGLGMAIVAAVVADHQAYIRALDNEPFGARFVINFPLPRAAAGGRA